MSELSVKEKIESGACTVSSRKVALWAKGLMMTIIPYSEAIELVASGSYRWIHDGAIDWTGRSA